MNVFIKIAYYSICNTLNIIKSPFLWTIIGIIFFQYRKIGKLEKNILGRQKTSPIFNALVSTAFGLVGGVFGSILFIYFGITINPKDFYFILPLAILLSTIHSKFMCFSYAGGIISLVSLILGWPNIHVSEILFVIGVLHLVESFLVLMDGGREKTAVFMERQDKIIGGFNMYRLWPVPFTIFINNGVVYPATIIAILGYGDYVLSSYPEKKAKDTAIIISIYSIILLFLSKLSMDYYFYKYIAAIFAPLGHELIIMIGCNREEKREHIFTPSNYGLKILDVLPYSIGEKIGLKSGDIILSINGKKISNKEDLEYLLYFRPNFVFINLFDREKGLITKEYRHYKSGIDTLGVVVISNIPD